MKEANRSEHVLHIHATPCANSLRDAWVRRRSANSKSDARVFTAKSTRNTKELNMTSLHNGMYLRTNVVPVKQTLKLHFRQSVLAIATIGHL